MGKNFYLILVISLLGLMPFSSFGQSVDGSYMISWPFSTGAEGQVATYSDGSTDYFKPDYVGVGSNLGFAGARTGYSSVTYTQFDPVVTSSAIDETNVVSFNVWPKAGLSFTPTLVEFDCERFGTGSGMIDVIWRTSDGTGVTIGTDIKPNRVNYTDGVFHASIDLSAETISASDGACSLEIYITELGDTKQVGIANIELTGDLSGTIINVSSYTVDASVSVEGAGEISSLPVGTEFDENTEVTLSATRNFGYEFSKWVDENGTELSAENPYTFNLVGDVEVVAVFSELVTYSLDLNISGSEWGEVVLSPEPTGGKYEAGTTVSATVVDNPVTTFLYWDDSSSETMKTVVMNSDVEVTATFDEIPFIVGWDFRELEPKVSRSGDFYSETFNTGSMSAYKADGSPIGWLAHSPEYSPSLPNARLWTLAADFLTDRRYYMANFSTENYTDIVVNAKMIASWQAYSIQKFEYSINGTDFTQLATIDLTDGYNASWTDFNVTLPEAAEGQTKVYVRWVADETSPILGDDTKNDGTAITNVFVFANKVVVDDNDAPVLLSTVPAEGADNASANGSITLTFDERVAAGTGDCTLGSVALTPIFGAKTATFRYEKLDYDTEYTFTVPAGAITDQSANAYAGIVVNFRTMARPTPTPRLYDAVVALDGSGDYETLQEAIDNTPNSRALPWLIFIKDGKYEGHIFIPETKPFIHLIGQSTEGVIVSDDRLAGYLNDQEMVYHVSEAATVVAYSTDCYFENITFENSYGFENQAGPQALAMYTNNDRITFKNCTLRSYQDTYLTSTNTLSDRHYLENCRIEGAVDYIYGGGDVFFDACTLYNVRQSGGYIVAPNHEVGTLWGYVFNQCILDGNEGVITYYGRPWHNSPKTIFLNSVLKCDVYAGGWYYKMNAIPAIFADYGTMDEAGNLVDLSNRIEDYEYDVKDAQGNVTSTVTGTAKNSLTDEEAATYTYENVLLRSGDTWDPRIITEETNVPAEAVLTGNELAWDATPYAMCYVITRNDVVIGFTTETTYTDETAQEGEVYNYTIQAASEYGALSAKSEVISNAPNGVDDVDDNSQVKVVAKHKSIFIDGLTQASVVSIYDLAGRVVYQQKCVDPTAILYVASGVYIVSVFTEKDQEVYKVSVR